MSKFVVHEYMREMDALTAPVRNRVKSEIKAAFPNKKMQMDKIKGLQGVQFHYNDLANLLYNLSNAQLRHLFYEVGMEGGREGITVVKQRFRARDPDYSRRNQFANGIHDSMRARLKRQSTGKSIYRYVADHLNFRINKRTGTIYGFVGETLNEPATGSRGQVLTPLVEGMKGKQPKAPMNMSVYPSIGYKPQNRRTNLPHMIKMRKRVRQDNTGKGRGRKPKPLKYPGNKPDMVPVDDPIPIPFIEHWTQRTLERMFTKFMAKAQEQIARREI